MNTPHERKASCPTCAAYPCDPWPHVIGLTATRRIRLRARLRSYRRHRTDRDAREHIAWAQTLRGGTMTRHLYLVPPAGTVTKLEAVMARGRQAAAILEAAPADPFGGGYTPQEVDAQFAAVDQLLEVFHELDRAFRS